MDSGEFEKGDRIDVRLDEQESLTNQRKQSIASTEHKAMMPNTARPGSRKANASTAQTIHYLLSNAALAWCRPEEETLDIKQRGENLITYSKLLSPFEELLCAVIVSRPVPHRLGLRIIRMILNPPHEFRHPVAIKMAGSRKIQQALWSTRMQHKGRTAEEIDVIAAALADNEWHNDLPKIRKLTKHATGREREAMERKVKGLGQDGLDIFFRRIQWCWPEVYPFIDSRAQTALERLGLPTRAEEIQELIELTWTQLGGGEEKFSEEERKRRAFVMLLDRAVGADAERNIEEVLGEALEL